MLGSAQIAVAANGLRITAAGRLQAHAGPDLRRPSSRFPATSSSPRRPSACRCSATPIPRTRSASCCTRSRSFPSARISSASTPSARRSGIVRLLRDAGYAEPIHVHGALRRLCDYYAARGIDLGELPDATLEKGRARDFAGTIVLAPPSAFAAPWVRRFADPLIGFASGWMQVRARARQRGVELPLVISDHCDWTELTATIDEIDPAEVWVTHGREEALVRWCALQGRSARPLHLVGYEDEADD